VNDALRRRFFETAGFLYAISKKHLFCVGKSAIIERLSYDLKLPVRIMVAG
jgi:hypothetical protein